MCIRTYVRTYVNIDIHTCTYKHEDDVDSRTQCCAPACQHPLASDNSPSLHNRLRCLRYAAGTAALLAREGGRLVEALGGLKSIRVALWGRASAMTTKTMCRGLHWDRYGYDATSIPYASHRSRSLSALSSTPHQQRLHERFPFESPPVAVVGCIDDDSSIQPAG